MKVTKETQYTLILNDIEMSIIYKVLDYVEFNLTEEDTKLTTEEFNKLVKIVKTLREYDYDF